MQEQHPDPLIEEALRWSVVLKSRTASADDRAAFDLWLQADPRHEAAWMQAQQVWMRVGKIGPAFANRAPPPKPRQPTPAPGARPPLAATPAMRPAVSRPAPVSRRRLFFAAAAVAAIVAPTALVLSRPGLFADQRTAVGERRTVALPDGSTIELAGASALSVDFTASMRRVVLQEGEAFFNVAHDPARPFVVEAASGHVQALGTAFDIKLGADAVVIAVSERSVEVSLSGVPPVIVREGQQVRYGAGQLSPVREADLAQVQAWRHDRLVFQEVALGDVIADLERYRGGRIVTTDSRLRDMPVSGEFDTRQADAAIDTLASALSIRVRRLTDFLVVLSPKA